MKVHLSLDMDPLWTNYIEKARSTDFSWHEPNLSKSLPNKRGVFYMIEHNDQNNQLPNELKSIFDELEIFKHL